MRDGVWYVGTRDASGRGRVEKHVDDRPAAELSMRRDPGSLPSHAFEWGGFDEGSGQLALALCADVLGDDHAEAVCHKFKAAVVAGFPLAGFRITATAIEEWAKELEETRRVPPMPREGVIFFDDVDLLAFSGGEDENFGDSQE